MKFRQYIILPALSLLAVATSCEQQEMPPAAENDGDVVEIVAKIGEVDTRVAQVSDNVFSFERGDAIHVVGW